MRKLISLLPVLALITAAPVWANNCPVEMKAIDAKLATSTLSKEQTEEVKKLRADGETFHKAGKHSESMESLSKAKKLLGI